MRDGNVNKGVYGRYSNEIILIADWAAINQLDWFAPFGLEKYGEFKVPLEDENKIRHKKQMKEGRWMDILKNSHNVAVFDQVGPHGCAHICDIFTYSPLDKKY
jgi:hypothetical protein